jgi:serine/threonine protein kinase
MTEQEFSKRYSFHPSDDKIGAGAFGTVYKAYDNSLDKVVAIKIAEVKEIKEKEFSLLEEYKAIKNLKPFRNIANYEEVHRIQSISGLHDYAIMQYYPLGNLSEYLKSNELTIKEKESLIIGILDGIAFLHKNKVVHRDLKPSNIMVVDRKGELIPKITDFGLSKQIINDQSSLFKNSFIGGTLQYSSPEQLRGKTLRLNTDLWSFGAIIYEIFKGNPLFEADKQSANSTEWQNSITQKILHEDISNKLENIPKKWQTVIKVCLKKDIDERIQKVEDIFKILGNDAQKASNTFNRIENEETTILDTNRVSSPTENSSQELEYKKNKVDEFDLANMWQRFLNSFIDFIIIILLSITLNSVYVFVTSPQKKHLYGDFSFELTLIIFLLYYCLFEYFFYRTPGKFLTKTRVVNQNNDNPKLISILIRNIVRISSIIDVLVYLLFSNKPLHDLMSKTYVVKENSQLEKIKNYPKLYKRIIAFWLDIIFLIILSQGIGLLAILFFIDIRTLGEIYEYAQFKGIMILIGYACAIIQLPVSEAIWKKTLGKQCFGLRVVGKNNKSITVKHVFIRFLLHPTNIIGIAFIFLDFFGRIESLVAIFGIVFSIVIYTEAILAISNNRSLADIIAGTMVIKNSETYEIE